MNNNETGFIEAAGAKMYYEAQGAGTPVTLIHAGVAHLRMWDAQVEAWRGRHRVIRYDTRGFGRTLTEDVPYRNVDDLLAVLDGLGVERTHLVGLSRGAMIALDFTVAHPERVGSLTWVAGGVRGLEVDDDARLVETFKEMERLEEARDWEPLVELETQVWTDGPGQLADRVNPELRRRMVEWNLENYRADQRAEQSIMPGSAAEHLADIAVPTLVVWGTFDETSVGESGEKLVADVAGAQKHVFEGVAHMVNLEQPEEFNGLVGDFIDRVDSGTAAPAGGDR